MSFIEINTKKKVELEAEKARAESRAAYAQKEAANAQIRVAQEQRWAEEAKRERAATSEVLYRVRKLIEKGDDDLFVELLKLYQQYSEARLTHDNEKWEPNDAAKKILPYIQGYNVPTDQEGLKSFWNILEANKSYIEKLQDDEHCKVYLENIYEELEAKGNQAYDKFYAQNPYTPTEAEETIGEKIDQLAKESRYDVVMDIIALYPKVSVLHKHGSQKGKEMSPVAMKVFDYLLKYKAPSDRSELESLMSLVEEKKGWLKQIGNDYPTLKMKKSTYAYERSPYDLIKKEIDRVIKTNYKDVTDGIIGSYNDAKAKQRKYILIGAVVVVAIVLLLILLQ